jgi:hypothetical protein
LATRLLAFTVAACAALVACLVAPTPADAQFRRNSNGQLLIDPLLCHTDLQVRQAIAAHGFTNIYLNAPIEDVIRARATRGGTVYLIDFNRCRGGIIGIAPLRPAR